MPAQKRSSSENNISGGGGGGGDEEESLHQHYSRKQSRREQQRQAQQLQLQQEQQHQQQNDEGEEQEADAKEEQEEEDDDSDGSVTDPEEITEYITVKLSSIRKDVQCPICLGIIKKTRTVMECMHRFCRECIDKSMRMGNNECPACRTHCASRRSLRDDPRYDALIEALYPDIEKYEEEELTFHEEERNRNKQIQASIAEISRRQSEALVKRRAGRDSGAASTSRVPRSCRNAYSRRRRNNRSNEIQGSDDNEDEFDHDGNNDYSSDELGTEIKQRRCKRRTGGRPSQPSPSAANSDGGYFEHETENRTSPGPVRNRELELTWGGGGARSHTRHGIANGRGARTRLSKLVDYLHSLKENDNELDVHLMLVPLSKQKTPSLQQPYLSCRPSLTVKHLCEHVACEMSLQAEEVQMVLETPAVGDEQSTVNNLASFNEPNSLFQVLGGQDTLARVEDSVNANKDHLILSYKQKEAI